MLVAHIADFKQGFNKHYSSYLYAEKLSVASKRLLLYYCVECGLKHELLKMWEIVNPSEIMKNKDHPKHDILCTHDLAMIIKVLNMSSQFRFTVSFKTVHKEKVRIKGYHECYRYGISVKDSELEEQRFEEELKNVADWLHGRV